MRVYHSLEEFKKLDFAVVTSGTFDGVHYGHQRILERLKEVAGKSGGETVLLTYWPHPRFVLFPEQELYLLSSIEEKIDLLSQNQIDHLIILPFTKTFAHLSSEEFIRDILVEKIGTRKLVIGYDHKFGKNREGSFEVLKKDGPLYGFDVEEIPKQMIENNAVSSTKIRRALMAGDVSTAREYLGRPYCINGKIVEGDKIGRTLDFPTANIEVSFKNKLIPAEGIYAVMASLGHRRLPGMLNIGYRPTFGGTQKRVEVHLFNFSETIYGRPMQVEFIGRIRSEIKFENAASLKAQLRHDKEETLKILKQSE